MDAKTKWITDTGNSLDNLKRAETGPFLHTRIMARLEQGLPQRAPAILAWVTACLLLVLLAVNTLVLGDWKKQSLKSNGAASLATQLHLINNSPVNYN